MSRSSDHYPADDQAAARGKGRPTPTRAEREAARRRPLVADTKEARAERRAEMQKARERQRIGMAAGDERYLPLRDRGPQRRWVRDYVDSRWHVAEYLMPLMLIVVIVTLVPSGSEQFLAYYAFVGLWAFVLLSVIGMILLSSRVKKKAALKFGADRVEKGLGWYAAMRSLQMRFMRLPKPQVGRGQRPD